jgi:hypothetical protein
LELHRILTTLMVVALAPGCGRLGYDLLPERRADNVEQTPDGSPDALRDGSVTNFVPDSSASGSQGDGAAHVGCTGAVAQVSDVCASVPGLPVTPVVDGLPDCDLPLYRLAPEAWDGDAGAPDAVASYAVAFRPNGLYFYVQVTDPTAVPAAQGAPADQGDAVELFVDADGSFSAPPAFDGSGTRRFVVAAPSNGAVAARRGDAWTSGTSGSSPWASTQFVAKSKSFGYVVEAFVSAADLGLQSLTLAAGSTVGFDIAIDVSYPTEATTGANGRRMGRYFLHVGSGAVTPDQDVRAFCTPTLAN